MSLVINSVISIYYYLRIIKIMFTETGSHEQVRLSFTGNLVLAIVVIGILVLGIIPSFLSEIINRFSGII
jgi:NADH:ubiquinone oxidoreductase subunit 2 (subunit N)